MVHYRSLADAKTAISNFDGAKIVLPDEKGAEVKCTIRALLNTKVPVLKIQKSDQTETRPAQRLGVARFLN